MSIGINSDIQGFAAQGGAVNFVKIGDNLKLLVNIKYLAAAKLKLSSKLLQLAIVI